MRRAGWDQVGLDARIPVLQVQVQNSDGAHCFDDYDCAGDHHGIVASFDGEAYVFTAFVNGVLRLIYGGRGFEIRPCQYGIPVGYATQYPAMVVCCRPDLCLRCLF